MALAISSIPVLTGQAAKDFELQAQRTYAEHINSSEVEKAKINSRYEKGMQLVREILNNSDLSNICPALSITSLRSTKNFSQV